MNVRLEELPPEQYARLILPQTESLWAGSRTFDAYVAQTLELAQTRYGQRKYRTVGLVDEYAQVVASFKRYERDARAGSERLRAIGIGAVFTPQEYRGRGFATAMLALALDEARAAGFDFAYLFTDIHPQFYKQLGFVELGSRSISLRADNLLDTRIEAHPLDERDWPGLRACFERCDSKRTFGLTRSALVWEWIRTRLRQRREYPHGQPVHLVLRAGGRIRAYVLGQREPRHDAYVVDEFAFSSDRDAELVQALIRRAAGDLRRVVAWLAPYPARSALPRGALRRRTAAVWMVAPLTPGGSNFLKLAQEPRSGDGIWSLDHI